MKDRSSLGTGVKMSQKHKVTIKQEKDATKKPTSKRLNKKHTSQRKMSVDKDPVTIKREMTPLRPISDQDRTGRCPVCMMPFSALTGTETPTWHVDVCQVEPYSTQQGNRENGVFRGLGAKLL